MNDPVASAPRLAAARPRPTCEPGESVSMSGGATSRAPGESVSMSGGATSRAPGESVSMSGGATSRAPERAAR